MKLGGERDELEINILEWLTTSLRGVILLHVLRKVFRLFYY